MYMIIQYERIDKGLFHVFAGGRHIGLVVRQGNGWFFRSNSGYFSDILPSRGAAVMAWPQLSEYQLSMVVQV